MAQITSDCGPVDCPPLPLLLLPPASDTRDTTNIAAAEEEEVGGQRTGAAGLRSSSR